MDESPPKQTRPLEVQSPKASDIAYYRQNNLKASPFKGTPSSSSTSQYLRDIEDETEATQNHNYTSFQLSPIVCVDLNTPRNIHMNMNMTKSETPLIFVDGQVHHRNDSHGTDGGSGNVMETSFPDNREDTIELNSPNDSPPDDERERGQEETDEERMQREIEESEALARQLMAEEAMASYAMSTEYLRDNADQFSSEDFAALQAAMAEEDPQNDPEEGDDDDDDNESDSRELSYDALLRLGERIGDVKEERWTLIAREKINQLVTLVWTPSMAEGEEANRTAVKCQVCQFPYDECDELRELPCGHYFHKECIDSWLETKDTCALCRRSIIPDE